MTTQPKVSVVVPIYGVEKYLRQCLDSILAQTLKEIEIILIDDGSPDQCPQIVDEYAAKDERVIAIHQPNGGYGVAVNNGIFAATGEYIGIIESDDWIEPTMYEKLYNNAISNHSDVVKCSFYVYDPTEKATEQNIPWKEHKTELFDAPDGVFTLADFPKIIMSHASIWAALYRADFVKKIKLVESRSASYQDFPFMCEVMSTANRISVYKECLVHWRKDAENNSTSQRGKRCIVMTTQSAKSIEILKQNGTLDLCREEIYWHAFRANISFFREIPWEFKKQYFNGFHRIYTPLIGDKTFRFKYFPEKEIAVTKAIIAGDFKRAIRQEHYSWLAVRRAIFSLRLPWPSFFKGKHMRLIILGIQIARNKDDVAHHIPCWKRIILRKSENIHGK